MRKKGFTLVEVLGILIIMGIITLIAVPLVYSIIKSSREGLYARQIEQLLQAGENWGSKNIDQLPGEVGQSIFLEPKDLAKQGFIDAEEIIDPRDGKEMNGCIVVTKETQRHTYKYEETSCDNLRGEYLIRFDDNLNLNEKVEVNSVYQPQNVTATSLNGAPVTVVGPTIINEETGNESDFVDTSTVGTKYKLNYVATDTEGNSKALTIKVTIVDTIAPEIVVQGKSKNFTYYYPTGEGDFKIPVATVTDNSGRVKKYNGKDYKVTSNVSNLAGTYRIVYEAEDYSGNKRKLTVTVVIANTDLPVIKEVTGNPTEWQNKDVTLKISEVASKSKIVEYSFDDGLTWQTVNSKVFDTNQTVKIKVKDQDGNISETFEVVITKIDKEPPAKPTVTLHKNNSGGEIISSGTWVNTDVSQVQHTTDNLSGIKGYERSLDKKKWISMATNATETKEQEQHYYVRAKDKAGNVSDISEVYVVRIDKVKPACTSSGGSDDWKYENVTLTGMCKDKNGTYNSGCVDDVIEKIISNNTEGSISPGTVYDHAGNSASCPKQNVKLDKNDYTIIFKNCYNQDIKKEVLKRAQSATAPASSTLHTDEYKFYNWVGSYTNVDSNRTITASCVNLNDAISYGACFNSCGNTNNDIWQYHSIKAPNEVTWNGTTLTDFTFASAYNTSIRVHIGTLGWGCRINGQFRTGDYWNNFPQDNGNAHTSTFFKADKQIQAVAVSFMDNDIRTTHKFCCSAYYNNSWHPVEAGPSKSNPGICGTVGQGIDLRGIKFYFKLKNNPC